MSYIMEDTFSEKDMAIILEILNKLLVDSGEIENLNGLGEDLYTKEEWKESNKYTSMKKHLRKKFIRIYNENIPRLKTYENYEYHLEGIFELFRHERRSGWRMNAMDDIHI